MTEAGMRKTEMRRTGISRTGMRKTGMRRTGIRRTGIRRAGMTQDERPENMAEGMSGGMSGGIYGGMNGAMNGGITGGMSGGMDMAAEETGEAEGLGADDDEILESLEILESPEVPDSLEAYEAYDAYDAKLNEAYAAPDPGSEVPQKKTRRGRKPGTGRRRGRPRKSEQKQAVAETGQQDLPGQDLRQNMPEQDMSGSAVPGQAADLQPPARNFMVADCGSPMTPEDERQMVQESEQEFEESLGKKTHPMLKFLKPGTDLHKISLAEAQQMMRDRLGLPDNGVLYRHQAPITHFCSDNGVPCYRDPQIQQEKQQQIQQEKQMDQHALAGQAPKVYFGADPRADPRTDLRPAGVLEDEKVSPKSPARPVAGASRDFTDRAALRTAEAGGDDRQPHRQQEADTAQNTGQDTGQDQEAYHGPESAPAPHSGADRIKQTKADRLFALAGRLFVLLILIVLAGLAVWFSWTGSFGEGGSGGVPRLAAPVPDTGGMADPAGTGGNAASAGNADLYRPQAQDPESGHTSGHTSGRASERTSEGVSEGISGKTSGMPASGASGMAEDSSLADADGAGTANTVDAYGMTDMTAQEERLSEEDVLSYLASREASRKASGKARQEENTALRDGTLPAHLNAPLNAPLPAPLNPAQDREYDSEDDSSAAVSNDAVPSKAQMPQGSGTLARDGTRLEARLSAFEESLQKTEAGLLILQQMLRDSLQQKPAKDSPAAGSAVKEEAEKQASDAMQQDRQKIQETKNDGRKDKKTDKKTDKKDDRKADKKNAPPKDKSQEKEAVSSSENPALKGWRIQGLSDSRAILQDARGRLWNMGAGEQTGSFMVHRVDAAKGLVYTSRGILSLKAGK